MTFTPIEKFSSRRVIRTEKIEANREMDSPAALHLASITHVPMAGRRVRAFAMTFGKASKS